MSGQRNSNTPEQPLANNPWHALLEAYSGPTPILDDQSPGSPLLSEAPTGRLETKLADETLAALRRTCDACGVAWETLVRAAWALVLSRHHREGMVWFGSLEAGDEAPRPFALSVSPHQTTLGTWLANAEHAARERSKWPKIHESELIK